MHLGAAPGLRGLLGYLAVIPVAIVGLLTSSCSFCALHYYQHQQPCGAATLSGLLIVPLDGF